MCLETVGWMVNNVDPDEMLFSVKSDLGLLEYSWYDWYNKQIPWGIYVPRLIFIWGVKNGKVNQRTIGPVSIT